MPKTQSLSLEQKGSLQTSCALQCMLQAVIADSMLFKMAPLLCRLIQDDQPSLPACCSASAVGSRILQTLCSQGGPMIIPAVVHCGKGLPYQVPILQVTAIAEGFLQLFLNVQGGTDSQSKDFATIVYRMQLLGMNAVRIPFSFLTIYAGVPGTFAGSCAAATYSQIIAGLTPPTADPTAAANAQSTHYLALHGIPLNA